MSEIVWFDIESTGINVVEDKIVQISAIKTTENLDILSIKDILINPECPIPKESTDVHHITDEMVAGKGTFNQYSKGIYEYFNGCILGGYNIKKFDIPMLSEHFIRSGITWPDKKIEIIDSFEIFIKREPRNLSAALKFYTGKDIENAHDAKGDVLTTIDVIKGQKFMYCIDTINDLLNECKDKDDDNKLDLRGMLILKDGVPHYNFGKAKGIPIKNDIGFGNWMLNQGFIPTQTKNILKTLL